MAAICGDGHATPRGTNLSLRQLRATRHSDPGETIRDRWSTPHEAFGQCQSIHLRESLLSRAVERIKGYRSFHRGTVDLPPCLWITEHRVATSLGEYAACSL